MTKNTRRIDHEKAVVLQMIRLYCLKHEGHTSLCPECKELLHYACERLDKCRFALNKPTCRKCPIHCYKPEMKAKIVSVMRWSGPRMILYRPLSAIKHMLRELM
ncbi:MAG: nitrous oxide-stimulated promoter family protein [Muribaculaceae bacterium]